jgi:hypothetical protein
MKNTTLLSSLFASAFVLALGTSSLLGSAEFSHAHTAQTARAYTPMISSRTGHFRTIFQRVTRTADTHSDICLQNEQQCLQGCDGAQSCSNQCAVNYQGCMDQGG